MIDEKQRKGKMKHKRRDLKEKIRQFLELFIYVDLYRYRIEWEVPFFDKYILS